MYLRHNSKNLENTSVQDQENEKPCIKLVKLKWDCKKIKYGTFISIFKILNFHIPTHFTIFAVKICYISE